MSHFYSGPPSSVSLDDGSTVLLIPGSRVELPVDHPYTRTLVALGYLKPCPASQSAMEILTMGRKAKPNRLPSGGE